MTLKVANLGNENYALLYEGEKLGFVSRTTNSWIGTAINGTKVAESRSAEEVFEAIVYEAMGYWPLGVTELFCPACFDYLQDHAHYITVREMQMALKNVGIVYDDGSFRPHAGPYLQ